MSAYQTQPNPYRKRHRQRTAPRAPDQPPPPRTWLPWAALGGALLLFGLSLPRGLSPLLSAAPLASALRVLPFPLLNHPLWEGLVAWLGRLMPHSGILLGNGLSLLFGALTVGLTCSVAWRWTFYTIPEKYRNPHWVKEGRVLSAWVSAATLAVMTPFWLAATRAHPGTLDLCILLAATWLLQEYGRTNRRGPWLYAAAALWGVGAAEFATMFLFAPLAAGYFLHFMSRAKHLKSRYVLTALGCALLGLALWMLKAWTYWQSPAAEWRDVSGYGHALWFVLREHYRAVRSATGNMGWILTFILTVLPWSLLYVFPLSHVRGVKYSRGAHFMLGVFALLSIPLLFDLPMAPWRLQGLGSLTLTPYLLFALWWGRLLGYAWLMAQAHSPRDNQATRLLRRGGRLLLRPLAAILVLVAATRAFRVADPRPTNRLHQAGGILLDEIRDREWLLTNGLLDEWLGLLARDRGQNTRLLNLRLAQSLPYQRYTASRMTDGRLSALARIGLQPMLRAWFERDPRITDRVAILTQPDEWTASGLTPVPAGAVYLGAPDQETHAAEALWARSTELWTELEPLLSTDPHPAHIDAPWFRLLRRHLSRLANDLGVYCEDVGAPARAAQAYARSRAWDADNLSALMNQLLMAERAEDPAADALRTEFERRTGRETDPRQLWGLSFQYGLVRSAEVFVQRGLAWAMSGKSNLAVAQIRHAQSLGADNVRMQLALATLFQQGNNPSQSEGLFTAALQTDPEHPMALLGLARLRLRNANFPEAQNLLDRAAAAGAPPAEIELDRAIIMAFTGDPAEALQQIAKLAEASPRQPRPWMILAMLAVQQGAEEEINQALAGLTRLRAEHPDLALILAHIETLRGNFSEARNHLETALVRSRDPLRLLESLLRLDTLERKRDLAEERAQQIVRLQHNHALANYILGSIHYSRHEYGLAEQAYRASLETRRALEPLNDLAWLLQKRKAYEEADGLIREALDRNPRFPLAWGTYAAIQRGQDRLLEAEESIQQALTLAPEHPPFILALAEIYADTDRPEQALGLATSVRDIVDTYDPELGEAVRSLIHRLRGY
ncbi:MAG: tetratricopeptide repeat protein [Candidatus Marinimicrobia bacterium]|nr:tetratricopeptide repeat protein [Candidatus Neomarinimicrobiota bacterium]